MAKKCPSCKKGTEVVRTNKTTKQPFFGCSDFPKCSYSRDWDGNNVIENETRDGIHGPRSKARQEAAVEKAQRLPIIIPREIDLSAAVTPNHDDLAERRRGK